LGRYEDAIAAYDAALAIKPDKQEALYNKACVYAFAKVRVAPRLRRTLAKAIQLSPDQLPQRLAKTEP
jgi:tetratricopeptide (TPR) repeat protein